MKYWNQTTKAVNWSILFLYLSSFAYGGTVELSTSDSAPTYVKDTNMVAEVVIDNSITATFTVTDTNGADVYVNYTLPLPYGASVISDTGYGTSTEAITVAFDSDACGAVNEIDLNVDHDNSNDLSPQCSKGKVFRFKVCIPKISVPVETGTYFNLSLGYVFGTQQTITGCDDFTQIEWLQEFSSVATYLDENTGAVTNYPNVPGESPANTNGLIPDGPNWSPVAGQGHALDFNVNGNSAVLSHDQHYDSSDPANVTIGNGHRAMRYSYGAVNYYQLDFVDHIRRHVDGTELYECEYDWGWKWDNYNIRWTNATVPPLPASIAAAVFIGTAAALTTPTGELYGVYSTDDEFQITP